MGKQRLEQKQTIHLTAKQIQFFNLLQIPITSLKEHIQKELEENPALEESEEENNEDLNVNTYSNYHKSNDFSDFQIEDKNESLAEYLHEQLIAIDLDEETTFLVDYLINSLDNSGFLTRDLYSISSDLLANENVNIDEEKLTKCLKILQSLEPNGVGAKDLQECLLIQLKKDHPKEKLAKEIISNQYKYFVNKNYDYLVKELDVKTNTLKEIYLLIESLSPIPSSGFSSTSNLSVEYVTPDFIVDIKNNTPVISPSKINLNSIRVSSYYVKLLETTNDKETAVFLKDRIEKAKWFKDALLKRDTTLKNIINAIVSTQKKYFISGLEKDLAPMKLADIAQIVNVDISTISRASNSKYLETHFGTFKVKELFSEAYRKDDGSIISTKEIKTAMKELVDNEDKSNPLTDEEITELLSENEYHIARRTVAKYRERLAIPISKHRKKL